MADELILPLLGYNGDDEEDDTTDSDEGIINDGEESEENAINAQMQNQIVYDTSLPSQHQYLGSDLNELSGRIVLDDGSFVNLPLLTLPGIVLVPGQILPLQLEHPAVVGMMRRIIDGDRTFGITSNLEPKNGTTAEIRSFGEENEDNTVGLSVLRVKAEGRQRFVVKETWRQIDGVLMGKVRILPDIELSNPLRIPTHSHIDRTLAACTRWPRWVYKLYDSEYLMSQIKLHLKNWCISPNMSNSSLYPSHAPTKPCEFSYWVAANLPLEDAQRCEVLAIDCSIQRLRWELSVLQRYSFLCCSECKAKICHRNDIFSMSVQGPQGTYVNPSGYVHEMITVNKVSSITMLGRPSQQYSWFPGYAWTICRCSNCTNHMGWKFTSINKRLKPESFWGLCRSSLEPGLRLDDDVTWKPVV